MSQIAINSSQNVNIAFTISNIGERFAAWMIDNVIKTVYLVIVYYISFRYFNLGQVLNGLDNWSVASIMITITFPIQIYTLVCESMMEGQTFGKKILKIKVVKIDGYQASFGDYLIRWFFRLIDMGIIIIGFISMVISKNNQRLGGIASGTAVISLKNNIKISHTILENLTKDYLPTFPSVVALSDNDVRIIKENYHRALATNDQQTLKKLSNKIKETLRLENNSLAMTERQFVGIIIKDFNFYTGKDL